MKKTPSILASSILLFLIGCSTTNPTSLPTVSTPKQVSSQSYKTQAIYPSYLEIPSGQSREIYCPPDRILALIPSKLRLSAWNSLFQWAKRSSVLEIYVNDQPVRPEVTPMINRLNAPLQYGGSWDPAVGAWSIFYDGRTANPYDYENVWDVYQHMVRNPPNMPMKIRFVNRGDGYGSPLIIGQPAPAPAPTPTPEPTINPAYNRVLTPATSGPSVSDTAESLPSAGYSVWDHKYPPVPNPIPDPVYSSTYYDRVVD